MYKAFATLLALGGVLAGYGQAVAQESGRTNNGTAQRIASTSFDTLKGDYVLIVPSVNSLTKPRLFSYEEFELSYGHATSNDETIQSGDNGEGIIGTPDPPNTGIGFESGDEVIYNRNNGPFSRKTVYRYGGSGVWYMLSNVLSGPFETMTEKIIE